MISFGRFGENKHQRSLDLIVYSRKIVTEKKIFLLFHSGCFTLSFYVFLTSATTDT